MSDPVTPLAGNTALVTGAATGIGKAIAEALAAGGVQGALTMMSFLRHATPGVGLAARQLAGCPHDVHPGNPFFCHGY